MMDDDKLLQRFPSPDGKRWFELRQQSDGKFYFQEFSEATDAIPVYGAQSYTSPGFRSGLYKSAVKRPKTTCAKCFPGWVEFQSKTPAGGFGRECAVTRGLCSITDKSASFLVANNKHVTGRSEICYDSTRFRIRARTRRRRRLNGIGRRLHVAIGA